jgi:hypothetical protein
MDETHYRTWWAAHTPAERADLLALADHQVPREVLDVIEHPDGIPAAAGVTANSNHGVVDLPDYLRTWNPNDDDPVTLTDQDD